MEAERRAAARVILSNCPFKFTIEEAIEFYVAHEAEEPTRAEELLKHWIGSLFDEGYHEGELAAAEKSLMVLRQILQRGDYGIDIEAVRVRVRRHLAER